jgi:hypothetical protein
MPADSSLLAALTDVLGAYCSQTPCGSGSARTDTVRPPPEL